MYYPTYVPDPFAEANPFRTMTPEDAPLPTLDAVRDLLPTPTWDGHEQTIACYWKVWELAFSHLHRPAPGSGFVANYIDTAFNDCIFLWDSAFILLFARYGRRAFDFQRTLDNFYAKQHPDGFICREIGRAAGDDRFQRFDPGSTGPEVMPWNEWEYFLQSGDTARLAQVFPALVAYHRWMRMYHTWRDGSYWSSGWGCGMDNQPRMDESKYHVELQHGHLVWVDACMQAVFSARVILQIAAVLGREAEVPDMQAEIAKLGRFINDRLWRDADAFYYDMDGDDALTGVKTIGAYWALLAGLVPLERRERFIAHLRNPAEFDRTHRIPTLSADHPAYKDDGRYWRGGVWAPTNYMVLRGLTANGQDALAHEIAINHIENVTEVFGSTGTVWENYAPEYAGIGNPSRPDFVGWTGLSPVTIMFEYAFGLRPDTPNNTLLWDVRLLEAHGVGRYPFGADGVLELRCAARASAGERPQITASSTVPLTLIVRWDGGEARVAL